MSVLERTVCFTVMSALRKMTVWDTSIGMPMGGSRAGSALRVLNILPSTNVAWV